MKLMRFATIGAVTLAFSGVAFTTTMPVVNAKTTTATIPKVMRGKWELPPKLKGQYSYTIFTKNRMYTHMYNFDSYDNFKFKVMKVRKVGKKYEVTTKAAAGSYTDKAKYWVKHEFYKGKVRPVLLTSGSAGYDGPVVKSYKGLK